MLHVRWQPCTWRCGTKSACRDLCPPVGACQVASGRPLLSCPSSLPPSFDCCRSSRSRRDTTSSPVRSALRALWVGAIECESKTPRVLLRQPWSYIEHKALQTLCSALVWTPKTVHEPGNASRSGSNVLHASHLSTDDRHGIEVSIDSPLCGAACAVRNQHRSLTVPVAMPCLCELPHLRAPTGTLCDPCLHLECTHVFAWPPSVARFLLRAQWCPEPGLGHLGLSCFAP